MTSSEFNAPMDPPERRQPRPSLARLLAPLQAAFQRTGKNFMLELEPMQAIDAFTIWSKLADAGDPASATTLLVRVPRAARRTTDAAAAIEQAPLAALARRVGVKVRETFAPDAIVLSQRAVGELITLGAVTDVVVVRIEGPVEASDAAAILDAIAAGLSPLEVELRAVAVMEIHSGNTVVITSRRHEDVLHFVAESLRNYLASVRSVPAATLAAPELGLVHVLLERTGRITVRPLETEVYASSIDVGISTNEHGEVRPADQSLIYDLHSGTWHGD